MSFRMKWSFGQAVQSTITFTILTLIVGVIFMNGDNQRDRFVGGLCALLITAPILVRWQHFYTIYAVKRIVSKSRRVYLEIGHREAFREYYRDEIMAGKVIELPILALDNGMVIAAESLHHLDQAKKVLREQWEYYNLLDNCEARYDALSYNKTVIQIHP